MITTECEYQVALGAESSNPDIRDYRIAKNSLESSFPESFELQMPLVKN